jgi:hypothetical protein
MTRAARLLLATVALLGVVVLPATAEPRLTVSPAQDLDPEGHVVTVRGSGYDTSKGVYVAFCVVPPPGEKPTPCGGGQDRDGSSGGSVWVSSFPPAYGVGLAEPYEEDGSFEVEIRVSRYIGEIDCFTTACAVVTRNDHERTEDRSQDVFAPVRFRGQPSTEAQARPVDESTPQGTGTPSPRATPTSSPSAEPGAARAEDTSPRSTSAATSQPQEQAAAAPTGDPTVTSQDTPAERGAIVVRAPRRAIDPAPAATESGGDDTSAIGVEPTSATQGPDRRGAAAVATLLVLAAAGAWWRVRRTAEVGL